MDHYKVLHYLFYLNNLKYDFVISIFLIYHNTYIYGNADNL